MQKKVYRRISKKNAATRNSSANKKTTLRLVSYSMLLGSMLLASILFMVACSSAAAVQPLAAKDNPIVFNEGILINEIDVSNLSLDEARSTLEKDLKEKLDSINYVLLSDSGSYTLTSVDLGISSDAEAVLQEAFQNNSASSENADIIEQTRFSTTLSCNEAAVTARLNELKESFNTDPVEPTVTAKLLESNVPEFTYTDGSEGGILDPEATSQEIIELFNNGVYETEVTPVFTAVAPMTSLDVLKENTQFRAKYTTRYRKSSSDEVVKNRCFNIQKGADLLNGCVLQPGEEFSFNGYVGLRSESDGWKLANGISGGKEYTLQAGGGICQVSTTLYNALLCGNINITYRKAHSIPSDYVPKGLDATVDSSGIDLNFMNDTYAPLYLFAYVSDDPDSSRYLNVTIELYGEPLPDETEFRPRSEVLEEIPRDDTKYTEDPTIPNGYQVTKIVRRDGYVADAFVDEYQSGKLIDTVSLGQSKYRGNPAEIAIGTGDSYTLTVPIGAEPVPGSTPPDLEIPVIDDIE